MDKELEAAFEKYQRASLAKFDKMVKALKDADLELDYSEADAIKAEMRRHCVNAIQDENK